MTKNHKYRLIFQKQNEGKFIGHLDLQTLFHRAIRRAALPIAYSEGFNPHQLVSFAQPLSLGYSSKGEIVEIYTQERLCAKDLVLRLNRQLPKGLQLISAKAIDPKTKPAAATIYASVYQILLPYTCDRKKKIEKTIGDILVSSEILVEKKTKRGKKDVNIREEIFSIDIQESPNWIRLTAKLAAGGEKNLKPDLLMSYILKEIGEESLFEDIEYTRLEILLKDVL